jgi:uncharacterized protein involved in exopolysaccharide biosynthesis
VCAEHGYPSLRLPEPEGPDRLIELAGVWQRVQATWRRIALLVSAATLVAAVVAFLLPPWYRSQASLLPPSEEDAGFSLAGLFRGIGVPGVKIPTQATPAEVFVAVLDSRRINEEIVRRFDLRTRYRKRFMDDALKELRRHRSFKLTQSGTLELAVEDRDRLVASRMASAYIELLDRFNREVRMTKGRRTRLFIEERLSRNGVDLVAAEQKLASYQSRHKTIALSPAASSAVETAARLYAQRTALQVQLGVVESYTTGASDEEQQIRQQLVQIDRRLAQIPETGVEMARLLRDVLHYEQLRVLLTAQYEEARINEVRDLPTLEILDPASLPERKARPRRGLLIGSAFLLSLALGVVMAATRVPRFVPREPAPRT